LRGPRGAGRSCGAGARRRAFGASAALALLLAPALLALPRAACGQADSGEAPSAPTIVLAPERAGESHARGADLTAMLTQSLTAMLRDSGRFRTILYSAKHPSVNRAILEHRLSAADLAEPMRPEGLQHLGDALYAQFVFAYRPVMYKSGMRTDATIEECVEPGHWRSLISEQIDVTLPAKRRLTQKQLIQLTVYRVAERLSISYALPEEIRDVSAQAASDKGKKGGSQGGSRAQGIPAKGDTGGGASGVGSAPQTSSTQTSSPQTSGTAGGGASSAAAQTGGGRAQSGGSQQRPAPAGQASRDDTVAPPPLPDITRAATETALAPGPQPQPGQTKVDEEALAARFRQQGDLANEISSLRRAINLRPLDAGLRQELVEAYQARQMGSQAIAEAERALQVAPDDARLHRLYGNLLRERDAADPAHHGMSEAALHEYETAVKLDPADAAAEVALGDAQYSDNAYAAALKTFQSAAQRDPKSPLPHRRLAVLLAETAPSFPDENRYGQSAAEFRLACSLTPPTDTATLLSEYADLVKVVHTRLTESLEELQNTYQANKSGQRTDLKTLDAALADLRSRIEKLSGFLDDVKASPGQEIAQAHYQQAAAFVLQAQSLILDFLHGRDATAEDAMTTARVNAHREMQAAADHLAAAVKRASEAVAPPPADHAN